MKINSNIIGLLIILCITIVKSDDDYYKLLGISKSADKKTIKQAYKKLAIKYHPDKNKEKGAEEQFLKVTRAYEILSDPEKRRQYDLFGESAFNQDSGHDGYHSFNMNDLFKDFDIFQNHHSSRDYQEDDDFFGGHFSSFSSMFGHDESDGGDMHSYHSEQTFSSGQRCTTTTRRSGNSVFTQTECH